MHGRITETGGGVYVAAFDHTGVEGRYCVDVSAVIEGEECFFDTYFLVRSAYDFDIIRTAEGVIDPTVQDRFDVAVDPSLEHLYATSSTSDLTITSQEMS